MIENWSILESNLFIVMKAVDIWLLFLGNEVLKRPINHTFQLSLQDDDVLWRVLMEENQVQISLPSGKKWKTFSHII